MLVTGVYAVAIITCTTAQLDEGSGATPALEEPRKREYSCKEQNVMHVTPDDTTLGACQASGAKNAYTWR